jgi:intermediate filament protein if
MRVSQIVKGEMSAKTTYQKSAKGPVSIAECAADGKYITLENVGRKDEPLGGWKLKRIIDGVDRAEFTLDKNYVLKAATKAKVWAVGCKPSTAPATDTESNQANWGVGANITTKLINQSGEDRATHVQKTIYTS